MKFCHLFIIVRVQFKPQQTFCQAISDFFLCWCSSPSGIQNFFASRFCDQIFWSSQGTKIKSAIRQKFFSPWGLPFRYLCPKKKKKKLILPVIQTSNFQQISNVTFCPIGISTFQYFRPVFKYFANFQAIFDFFLC